MIKRLLKCVREFKTPTVLTLVFIVCEVIIETFIPYITANLVNQIKAGVELSQLLKVGLAIFGMACLSLCCGGIAAFTCAKASAGFARNVRTTYSTRCRPSLLRTSTSSPPPRWSPA